MSAKNENICPACGSRDKTNMYMYGSPIRKCNRCGKEYLNRRFREVAIDGYDPKTTTPMPTIKALLGCIAMTIICFVFLHYFKSKLKITIMTGVMILADVFYLVMLLRYFMGIEKKHNEEEMERSEERLKDKSYVEKLQSYGYIIPSKYINDNN